jgi:hypothetical protein
VFTVVATRAVCIIIIIMCVVCMVSEKNICPVVFIFIFLVKDEAVLVQDALDLNISF